VGDHIVLNVSSTAVLKVSFLLYVFPILLMILGAAIGQNLAPKFKMDPSTLSLLTGLLFFLLSFVFVRMRSNRMGEKEEYRPRVIRIIK
jgi:sigma-E factor negative regulatory protein RseC